MQNVSAARRRRLRRRLALAAAMALTAAVSAGCSAAEAGSAGSSVAAPGPNVGQTEDALVPLAVTHTLLTSSTGRTFDLAELAGKVVVISDVMTLCQETCPLDTANVVAAAQAAERADLGQKVTFLSITIDPQRDTTAQLAAYRRLYPKAPADWVLARPAPDANARFWHTLGVYIQKVRDNPGSAPRNWRTGQPLTYDLTHSDEVFFLDANSRERFVLDGTPHVASGAPIPAELNRFMDAQGRRNVRYPQPGGWTLPQELDVLSWLTGHRMRSN